MRKLVGMQILVYSCFHSCYVFILQMQINPAASEAIILSLGQSSQPYKTCQFILGEFMLLYAIKISAYANGTNKQVTNSNNHRQARICKSIWIMCWWTYCLCYSLLKSSHYRMPGSTGVLKCENCSSNSLLKISCCLLVG